VSYFQQAAVFVLNDTIFGGVYGNMIFAEESPMGFENKD